MILHSPARVAAWLATLFLFFIPGLAQAQPPGKQQPSDYRKIEAPTIVGQPKAPSLKPAISPQASPQGITAPQERKGITFDPYRSPTVVSEDTLGIDDGEPTIVEVSEEVEVDSTWIRIAGYYSLWDTRNVNPYGIDPATLSDSVLIQLTDSALGRYYTMPLQPTRVNSPFGPRGYRFHYGIDLDLNTGDTVRSIFDGVVRITGYNAGGWGNFVVVRHYNGLETLYGHLSMILTTVGTVVRAGEMIGWGGSTGRSSGPHLHLEVRYQGNAIDPDNLFDWKAWALAGNDMIITADAFNYSKRVARRVLYHRVRNGDTLYSIARRYGTTVATLARLNRMSTRGRLRAGTRLRVK